MTVVPPEWEGPVGASEDEFGIIGKLPVAMFRATLAHESGRFKRLEENLSYSAERLMRVWPKRFPTIESTYGYASMPGRLADKVYGGRMGNIDLGDGWKYRGRGLIQLTGKANYRACGVALGMDLMNDPDLLLQKEPAARSAGWFWKFHGCQKFAEAGLFREVCKMINGGVTGMSEREALLEQELA